MIQMDMIAEYKEPTEVGIIIQGNRPIHNMVLPIIFYFFINKTT